MFSNCQSKISGGALYISTTSITEHAATDHPDSVNKGKKPLTPGAIAAIVIVVIVVVVVAIVLAIYFTRKSKGYNVENITYEVDDGIGNESNENNSVESINANNNMLYNTNENMLNDINDDPFLREFEEGK